MKSKWKFLLICFLMAAVFMLEPVSYVLADETTSGESYDRTHSVPRLNSSDVEFTIKKFFDWFGLAKVPEENVFKEFVLSHRKSEYIDYSLYDLVCEFEFKTMGGGNTIITSNYSYTIDFEYCETNWSDDHISVDDNFVYNYSKKKDGENYFFHEFIYKNIVKNADGFQERNVSGKDNYYTYNTVISQVDFYFVRKSDGERGQTRRYVFEWDSNFWLQKCVGISFFWYDHDSGIDKEIFDNENMNGIYGTQEEEDSAWNLLLEMLVDAPLILTALFTGIIEIVVYLSGLFHAVFPFIPKVVFTIFGAIILLTIFIAILKIVFSR